MHQNIILEQTVNILIFYTYLICFKKKRTWGGSRKTQPAGTMFLSSESPPSSCFLDSDPRARSREQPRRGPEPPSPPRAVRGFPLFFSPHSAQAGSCRVRPQGPLLPRRTRVRGLLPVGGGGAEGMGARRSRAWLAQRPWCGPRRSSQAPSASSVSGARLVAPTRSHSLPPRHSPRQPVVTWGKSLNLGHEGLCRGLPQVLGLENSYRTDKIKRK